MSAKKKTAPSFEEALIELETLVVGMEDGELSLEDTIKHYEHGVALGRNALHALDEAQQRVQILSENEHQQTAQDFEPDEG
ncbi:MAG: exodeoxyribonuclease VII small subunit [Gammaproteobacteria bacterium]|jgi:exodeoxyribonuclease VII small subunit